MMIVALLVIVGCLLSVFIMCYCVHGYFSASFIYIKINIKLSRIPLSIHLSLSEHNVIVWCIDISDFSNVDENFVSVAIIHLWAACFKTYYCFGNKTVI